MADILDLFDFLLVQVRGRGRLLLFDSRGWGGFQGGGGETGARRVSAGRRRRGGGGGLIALSGAEMSTVCMPHCGHGMPHLS